MCLTLVKKPLLQTSYHYTSDEHRADEILQVVLATIGHKATPCDDKLHSGCGKCALKIAIEPQPIDLEMINSKDSNFRMLWDPNPWSIITFHDLRSARVITGSLPKGQGPQI